MSAKLYDTDSVVEVARKIYYHAEIMQSFAVYGFAMDEENKKLIPRGELVLRCLKAFDEIDNILEKGERRYRNYKFKKDSVGGPIAHKIFTWEKRVVDSEPRYTIWRFQ